MIDENESAQAEGSTVSAKAVVLSRAEKTVAPAELLAEAVEAWYAKHFHKAALEGRQPISADEKAALVQAVTAAATPAKE